jgi:hypothetical protein
MGSGGGMLPFPWPTPARRTVPDEVMAACMTLLDCAADGDAWFLLLLNALIDEDDASAMTWLLLLFEEAGDSELALLAFVTVDEFIHQGREQNVA